MSIYGTTFSVGEGLPEDAPGRVSGYTDNDARRIAPAADGSAEVGLAHIPGYCWPGADEHADTVPDAPWVRLSVVAGPEYADVNLDVTAARSLRDALTDWIDGEHLPDLEEPRIHPNGVVIPDDAPLPDLESLVARVRDLEEAFDTVGQELLAREDRVRELEAALRDMAEHGIRFDLNPTVDGRDPHGAYTRYIGRIDASVRETARRALEATA